MNTIYKINATYKYACSVCGKQFNWSNNSFWYGNYIDEPKAYLCCQKCKEEYYNQLNEKLESVGKKN